MWRVTIPYYVYYYGGRLSGGGECPWFLLVDFAYLWSCVLWPVLSVYIVLHVRLLSTTAPLLNVDLGLVIAQYT